MVVPVPLQATVPILLTTLQRRVVRSLVVAVVLVRRLAVPLFVVLVAGSKIVHGVVLFTESPEGAHPTVIPESVGGRLAFFTDQWRKINPGPWVLGVISDGYRIEFSDSPPLFNYLKSTPVPEEEEKRKALEEEIVELLRKNAIRPATPGESEDLFRSSFFLAPKKGNLWRPNHQSEASKQVLHRSATIQDGNLIIDRTVLAEGDVGDVVGHQGCVPPHTHTSVVNEIPRLHVLAAGFRFSLPALRVVYRAEGVYQSLSCGGGASAFEGVCDIRIHRRLADCERIQRSVISRYGSSCVSIAATRLDNQSQEILSRPFTEDHLLGSSIRLRRRFSYSVDAQDRCSSTASVFLPSRLPLPGQALAPFARHHGKYGGPHRVVQAEDEGDSNTVTAPVQADQFTSFLFRATSEFGPDGLCNTGSSSGHFVVDGSESSPAGEAFSGFETSGVFNNGCFSVGLGRDLSVRDDVGSLVITGLSTTHQRSGAVSDKQLDPVLGQTVAGTSGDGIHGQRVGRSVHQPRGRDSLQPHVPDCVSDVAVLSVQRHSSASLLPARKGKRRGGCVVEGSSAKRRVVSKSAVGGPPVPHLRQTSSGSVCQPQKSQASNFLRLEDGGPRLARGCLQSRVGLPTRLRIPSVVSVAEDSIQDWIK